MSPTDHEGPGRAPTAERLALIGAVIIGVIVVTPVVVAGLDALGRTWYPAGDWAVLELRTMDVGGADTPLLGPYSRYGWNHPGPLLFWIFALPYRLTGGSPTGMLLGAASINAASVAGMLAFAFRRGGVALFGAVAVACSLLILNLGPDLVRDPWNPWVTVLPFGLLVLLAWSAVEGDRLALPLAALVGSFLVHAHVGFMVLVVALWAWAVLGAWRRHQPRRPLLVAGAVLALCWLPVVIDLVVGRTNLVDMVRHFAAGDEAPAGFGTAVGIAARQLGSPQPWLGGPEPADPIGGGLQTGTAIGLVVPLVAFAVAMALAWWKQAYDAVRFQATVGGVALVGVVSVSRVTDEVFNYLVRWWWVIAALWWVSAAWSVWTAFVRDREPVAGRARVAAGAFAAVAVLWFSVGTIGDIGDAPLPADDWYPALDAVAGTAIDQLPRGEPVLVESTGPLSGWTFDAFVTRLVAEGFEVRVDDEGINRNKFGDRRILGHGDRPTVVWVVTGTPVAGFTDDDRFVELARYDPLPPDERARYLADEAALVEQLRAAGLDDVVFAIEQGLSLFPAKDHPGVDQELLAEVERRRAAGVPLAVFEQMGRGEPPPGRYS